MTTYPHLLLAFLFYFLSVFSMPACAYTQVQVFGPLGVGERLCIVGDSEVGRGRFHGVGWMDRWDQLNLAYHSNYNFTIINAGYAYLSSTVLNYPGAPTPDYYWQTQVVQQQPTIVIISVGVDNILVNYGIKGAGTFDMAAYGVDLQNIINAARAIPSVRQVVLMTPWAAGERRYGQNPQDANMDRLCAVIEQTSINNQIPVIDVRSMIQGLDLVYNQADLLEGCELGDGIHPILSPEFGDKESFISDTACGNIAAMMFTAAGE